MAGQTNSPDTTLVLMGRIGAAHGIRGEVRIQSFTEDPVSIKDYSPLSTNKPGLEITILSARPAKTVIVARIAGVADRDAAEKLNGVELYIPRDHLPDEMDEDDFYHADLIGLEGRLTDGTVLGRVLAVPNFGADDLIEIGANSGKSVLYPFTRAVIPEIHVAEGYLVVNPPEEIIVEGEA
ncbi:ribosome maturation factor RimM [Mariluticola halotolerans]|uniref:ribosome maturation factor RimM n=1 Tax=Mariluticola halotolerans TaxID=2909283 RepID=UPI0026E145B4|nr:ribosome maturation factor RimM [Mariluticola halotolerans]UJQ93580.1 ribosome maturation factor RimM [Mariluticola halotolerans]